MNRTELARRIYRTANIRGSFVLRSGQVSDEYFDKYLFESPPKLLREIASHMLPSLPTPVHALAGLEMGGIPLVTMLSQLSDLPALFVRKKAKTYGTCRLVEGGDVDGRRLVVVEDVVTSAGQIVQSVDDLRQAGAVVDDVMCVIDREAGATANLSAVGLRFHPLFTMSEIKDAAGVP